jgi:hypothetical protein
MRKNWGFTQKILSGEKKIESRWYKFKHTPWDKIKEKDEVYFKNSGEPIKIKATVAKVIQFSDLTPKKVKTILNKFGKDDGIEKDKIQPYFEMFKDKNYCLLIYLRDVVRVKPFEINKKGFGAMAAWICVEDVDRIKRPVNRS